MNNIYQDKKDPGRGIVSFEGSFPRNSFRSRSDSQALQEIINVLKHPFQTSCDRCNGLGFVKSGEDCPCCDGSGKVLDKLFR